MKETDDQTETFNDQQSGDNVLIRDEAASSGGFGSAQAGAGTGVQMERTESDTVSGEGGDAALQQDETQQQQQQSQAPFMAEENRILAERTVKYNWQGRDLRVLRFAKNEKDEEIIVLQNPPGQGGESYAPLTETAKTYLLARIHV